MKKRFLPGRSLCALSALALILITLWELVIRLDAMYKPIKMFFAMAVGEGIPLSAAMEYFDFSIFHQPLYLTFCLLMGAIGLIFCRRPLLCLTAVPSCILLGIGGFCLDAIPLIHLWRVIRLVPLIGLSAGSLLNLAGLISRRRIPEQEPPRLSDAPKLRGVSHRSSENNRRSA